MSESIWGLAGALLALLILVLGIAQLQPSLPLPIALALGANVGVIGAFAGERFAFARWPR